MNIPIKGEVWSMMGGEWQSHPITEKYGKKYVTFFAGYDTITEEIEVFINGYTKEL